MVQVEDLKLKKYLYRYAMVTLGCVLLAIAINGFFLPFNLLSGGLSGYCILLLYLLGLPISVTNLLLNVPLFIIAYKLMSRDYFISGIFGTMMVSVCIQYFSFLSTMSLVRDSILACLAGGVLFGIGCALIFKVDGNTGGVDIIAAIIQKHYSISIGTTEFIGNLVLLTLGGFYYGLEPTLYTLLTFFISFKITNIFMDGFDYKKSFIIISSEYQAIGQAILTSVDRGVTYLQAEGGFTHEQRPAVFVVAKLTQMAKIKTIVTDIDPHAFMIIQDASDVLGRGFTLKAQKLG
jgi:uncharacterized membrane-anchored protein YitT (DUF2179 family)